MHLTFDATTCSPETSSRTALAQARQNARSQPIASSSVSIVQRKFLALAAHRSAFGITVEMLSSPPAGTREMLDAFRPVFEREVFVLGGTRTATSRWPLNDFFEGIAELDQASSGMAPA